MNKHTPGPWKARPYNVRAGKVEEYAIDSREWSEMAIVYVQEDAHDGDILGDGEANARLMAAAPSMLDALDALVAAVDLYEASGELVQLHAAAKYVREVARRAREG